MFSLNQDDLLLQQMLNKLGREKLAAKANEIDHKGEYPHESFELLKELGLFALPFPAEFGGTGSILSACVAAEELCRFCYNTGYVLVTQWAPFGAIYHAGTDEQKQRLLSRLASGEIRGAFSSTEPQSGSDVAGIKARAKKVEGGYILNGAKSWCTNAPLADFIVVAAKLEGDTSRRAINLFIVEKGSKGLTIGKPESKLGARGIPSCPLYLDDLFVPDINLLGGEEGKGFKAAMEGFNTFRPVVAARAVGVAQGAIDHSVEYLQTRYTFGTKVSDNQGIRWMVADMTMQTEAARLMVYKAASMVDKGIRGQELMMAASMAKAFATDVGMQVATDAVQLFGAAGISNDSPINRYMRDAKVNQIVEGTNQIQRNIIGNFIFGRPEKKTA